MLALQFQFLQPHYYSTDVQDPTRAEWPPHPDRLFAALVHAAYASDTPARYRPLLQWLARQAPPAICAPQARAWNDFTQFVPCKLKGSPLEDGYLKSPKQAPSLSLAALELTYVWPDAQASAEHTRQLEALLEWVGYLASPRNMAVARLIPDPPAATYVPDDEGPYSLRVPHASRLESLENQHRIRSEGGCLTYLDPDVRWSAYRGTDTPAPCRAPANRFRRVALFRLPRGPELSLTRPLAEALRNRLIACADRRYGRVPPLLHGHPPPGERFVPHVAFAPRAAVCHPYASGRIEGMALLLPVSPDWERDRAFLSDLLTHPDLREFEWGSSRVFLQPHESPQLASTREAAYQRPARVWTTVSPVMIDRFPTATQPLEAVLRMMLLREGVDLAGSILHCQLDSFVEGVPSVLEFHRHSVHHRRPSYHLRLELRQPVSGPLTLGTTRYVGLGHFLGLPAEGAP